MALESLIDAASDEPVGVLPALPTVLAAALAATTSLEALALMELASELTIWESFVAASAEVEA